MVMPDQLPSLSTQSLQKIDQSDQLAAELIKLGTAKNTVTAFKTDMRYFWRWCQAVYPDITDLPIPEKIIQSYVTDHIAISADECPDYGMSADARLKLESSTGYSQLRRGFKVKQGAHKLNTIKRRLSSLAKAHAISGFDQHQVYTVPVKAILRAARKFQYNTTTKKDAIDQSVIQQLFAVCDQNSFIGIRDCALLSTALYSGGRRRSEISGMKKNQLKAHIIDNKLAFEWAIAESKTHDLADEALVVPIKGKAAIWLDQLIKLCAEEIEADQYIFRRVDRWGNVGQALTPQGVRQIIKRLQKAAGLSHLDLSAHSLRAGFVTEMGKHNISAHEAMALSGHQDIKTFFSYYRRGHILQNKACDVFLDIGEAES
jgi:site-specific recombinase XerD